MKVALCISGHLRTFEQTFPALQEYVLDAYDCDIFISTWNDSGFADSSNEAENTDDVLDRARRLYHPLRMESEVWAEVCPQWGDLEFLNARRRSDAYPDRILGMWYKIWRANELKRAWEQQHGFVYDVVVRTRADVLHFETPQFSDISGQHIYIGNKFGYGGLPDIFAYGSSLLMDFYASLIHRIHEYASKGVTVHPETLLDWHLLSQLPQGIVFSDAAFRLCRAPSQSPAPLIAWCRQLQ